jgi:hypothetical protein
MGYSIYYSRRRLAIPQSRTERSAQQIRGKALARFGGVVRINHFFLLPEFSS